MSAWRASAHDAGTGATGDRRGRIFFLKCLETYLKEDAFEWSGFRDPQFHLGMFSDTGVFTSQTGEFADMTSRIA